MAPACPRQRLHDGSQGSRSLSRRRILGLGLGGTVAAVVGCRRSDRSSTDDQSPGNQGPRTSTQTTNPPDNVDARVLVAYFSRAGENYYYGDRIWLKVGNTDVVAQGIGDLIPCDLHEIKAAEPYPDDYDRTVERNAREQDDSARPAIANPLPAIDQYDIVLLGSPIWNVQAPMIMATFTEKYDFTGKTVHPFTTHAMSELGTTERDYVETCAGATIGEGLAIRGERARNARPDVADWLGRIGLINRS